MPEFWLSSIWGPAGPFQVVKAYRAPPLARNSLISIIAEGKNGQSAENIIYPSVMFKQVFPSIDGNMIIDNHPLCQAFNFPV